VGFLSCRPFGIDCSFAVQKSAFHQARLTTAANEANESVHLWLLMSQCLINVDLVSVNSVKRTSSLVQGSEVSSKVVGVLISADAV
jgi:hypothetical protein